MTALPRVTGTGTQARRPGPMGTPAGPRSRPETNSPMLECGQPEAVLGRDWPSRTISGNQPSALPPPSFLLLREVPVRGPIPTATSSSVPDIFTPPKGGPGPWLPTPFPLPRPRPPPAHSAPRWTSSLDVSKSGIIGHVALCDGLLWPGMLSRFLRATSPYFVPSDGSVVFPATGRASCALCVSARPLTG